MDKESRKIAIIGGGISGLVTGYRLKNKGYENITIFEKTDRLGGKMQTIYYKNKAYEIGTVMGLQSHKLFKKLSEELNVKADGPRVLRGYYDLNGNPTIQIPKAEVALLVEEIKRFPDVLSRYKSLNREYIDKVEDELMQTFEQWCNINKFFIIKKIYSHYYTSFGLGDINIVPAFYVHKIISYDNFMSFMDLPEVMTWKSGVTTLVTALENKLDDIRLTQEVIRIEKCIDGKNKIQTINDTFYFDDIIITSPLSELPKIYDLDSEIKVALSHIEYHQFNVYAFICENAIESYGYVTENLSAERVGHIILWSYRWKTESGKDLIIVYTYQNPSLSKSESLKVVEDDLNKLGFRNFRLYQFKNWQQCPFVRTEELKNGFYKKLSKVQGEHNIYLSGEIMSTASVENCIKHANYLVDKYF